MNSLFCVVLFGISSSVYSLNSSETYYFTSTNKESQNISVTTGTTLKFACVLSNVVIRKPVVWIKEDGCMNQIQRHIDSCHISSHGECHNMTVLSNIKCETNTSIEIRNVTAENGGSWSCRQNHMYGAKRYMKVTPVGTPSSKPSGTGSSTHQMEDTSISAGTSVNRDERTTINQPAHPTGSKPASNNFLLLVVGAAVVGVLVISLVAVVVALRRKKSHKERKASEPPNDDYVPEVEMIDPDGQYASVGQMKPPVAVMETNSMYETYEGGQNRNQNQNQNQNQEGIISSDQGDEGDVYSVVNKPGRSTVQEAPSVVDTGGDVYSVLQKKKQDPPATDGVQAGTPDHDTGGDVYSVVQKKKQDPPATDGVQAGTPDHDISDVYSVVQKPGKTHQ